MSQIIQADIIGQVGISGTTFSLAPSILTLGGQQYVTTSTLTLTLSPVIASTKYNIFAIQTSGVVSLVFTTLAAPAGQTAYKLIYTFNTDAISNIQNNNQWQTQKNYFYGDLVLVNDYLVRCITNHTAGVYATDFSSGYWQLLNSAQNILINSNLDICQRSISSSATTSEAIIVQDRWRYYGRNNPGGSGQSFTVARDGIVPDGSLWSMTMTIGNTTTNQLMMGQRVESNISSLIQGSTLSFSFLVHRRALTPPTGSLILVGIKAASGVDNFTGVDCYQVLYGGGLVYSTSLNNISNSSFQKVQCNIPITSVMKTNGFQIAIGFDTNSTSNVFTNGQFFNLAQFMLNVGPATALYQPAAPNVQAELAMCQRYYEKSYEVGVTPGAVTFTGVSGINVGAANTGAKYAFVSYKVTKRTYVSPTIYSPLTLNTTGKVNNGGTDRTAAVDVFSSNGFDAGTADTSSTSYMNFHWTVDADL